MDEQLTLEQKLEIMYNLTKQVNLNMMNMQFCDNIFRN
jgi:hypothetical protein